MNIWSWLLKPTFYSKLRHDFGTFCWTASWWDCQVDDWGLDCHLSWFDGDPLDSMSIISNCTYLNRRKHHLNWIASFTIAWSDGNRHVFLADKSRLINHDQSISPFHPITTMPENGLYPHGGFSSGRWWLTSEFCDTLSPYNYSIYVRWSWNWYMLVYGFWSSIPYKLP